MQTEDEILARARAYALFAELFTVGITDQNLALIKLIPDLGRVIEEDDISINNEKWGSEHYEIFGKNVHPYESIYLDVEMNLGGEITETISDFYHQISYDPPSSENADHIGVQLSAMAFLCRQALEFYDVQNSAAISSIYSAQQNLIENHILQWLPMLQQSLINQHSKFYISLCNLALELILDHHTAIQDITKSIPIRDLQLNNLLLEDKKTGLKDIALHILTPAYSGVFISQYEISRIARKLELPRGFGNRVQMFMNLVRAAVSFDALPSLLDEIRGKSVV